MMWKGPAAAREMSLSRRLRRPHTESPTPLSPVSCGSPYHRRPVPPSARIFCPLLVHIIKGLFHTLFYAPSSIERSPSVSFITRPMEIKNSSSSHPMDHGPPSPLMSSFDHPLARDLPSNCTDSCLVGYIALQSTSSLTHHELPDHFTHRLPGTSQNLRLANELVVVLHAGRSQRSLRTHAAACRDMHQPSVLTTMGLDGTEVRCVSFTTRAALCHERATHTLYGNRHGTPPCSQKSRRQPRTTYPRNQVQRTRRLMGVKLRAFKFETRNMNHFCRSLFLNHFLKHFSGSLFPISFFGQLLQCCQSLIRSLFSITFSNHFCRSLVSITWRTKLKSDSKHFFPLGAENQKVIEITFATWHTEKEKN